MGVLGETRRLVRGVSRLARGALHYRRTGETPTDAALSMIDLFCATGGLSNDVVHAAVSAFRRPQPLERARGILGDLNSTDMARIGREIRQNGYYVFPSRLSPALCDVLTAFARKNPAKLVPARPGAPPTAVYDAAQPLTELYKFTEVALIADAAVQALAADETLFAVAQAYLGSSPVLDIITMWWSALYKKEADVAEAAQLYHFDMDRPKWLKFFVYLTDVTPETGPHCFIARSHRRGEQPRELLRKGYARIDDAEVEKHFGPERRIEFVGPRGTIFAEDTRGFHKGKIPRTGDRLVFEMEYSDTLFGSGYERTPVSEPIEPALEKFAARYPRLFQKFILPVRE